MRISIYKQLQVKKYCIRHNYYFNHTDFYSVPAKNIKIVKQILKIPQIYGELEKSSFGFTAVTKQYSLEAQLELEKEAERLFEKIVGRLSESSDELNSFCSNIE